MNLSFRCRIFSETMSGGFKIFKTETSSRNQKRKRDEMKEKKRLYRFRWSFRVHIVDIELFPHSHTTQLTRLKVLFLSLLFYI